MESNKKRFDKDNNNPIVIPKSVLIPPSQEKGFDIQNCMDDIKTPKTYEKDLDYYFDSYSHFSIHEEMLKDKVHFFH